MHGDRIVQGGSVYDMRQCTEAVESGRQCVIIVQPTLEKRLGEGCMDKVEMIKPNESWEGKWNEHVGG